MYVTISATPVSESSFHATGTLTETLVYAEYNGPVDCKPEKQTGWAALGQRSTHLHKQSYIVSVIQHGRRLAVG